MNVFPCLACAIVPSLQSSFVGGHEGLAGGYTDEF